MRTALVATAVALVGAAAGADILTTNGFSVCSTKDTTITVQNLDISFDRSTNKITFDVQGTSARSQEVTATLIVEAYGKSVYNSTFDPCAESTKVDQLCPGMLTLEN